MPDEKLIAEARRRLEETALAKSKLSENEAWFKANWQQLGNLEHAGLVLCGRQQKREVLIPSIFFAAIYALRDEADLPFELLVETMEPKQMNELLKKSEWGERIKAKLKYFHDGGGIKIKWGTFNCTPVNKWPSENNYAILNPGDPLMKTEPDPEPKPQEEEPEAEQAEEVINDAA